MYISIYIHIYIYVRIYICMYVCIYIYMYVYIYTEREREGRRGKGGGAHVAGEAGAEDLGREIRGVGRGAAQLRAAHLFRVQP